MYPLSLESSKLSGASKKNEQEADAVSWVIEQDLPRELVLGLRVRLGFIGIGVKLQDVRLRLQGHIWFRTVRSRPPPPPAWCTVSLP